MRSPFRRSWVVPGVAAVAVLVVGAALVHGQRQAPAEPAPRLAAVALVAEDFEGMVTFYRDVLGFEVTQRTDGPFVELRNEGVSFQILTPDTLRDASGWDGFGGARSGTSFELAFEVDTPAEVDALYQRIVASGAKGIAPPEDKPWGMRTAYFADPDGNVHDVYAPL